MEKETKDRFKKVEERVDKIEKFIEGGELSKNGKLVHCPKTDCKYSWLTRSKLKLVSCPKCGSKVKID